MSLSTEKLRRYGKKFLTSLRDVYALEDLKRLNERKLLPSFAVTLQQRFGHITREVPIRYSGKTRRIDFRFGTHNPALIEVAVRKRLAIGVGSAAAPTNRNELLKLARFPLSKARYRFLLLIDLADSPLSRQQLEESYESVLATRGRVEWSEVTVVYIHHTTSFVFPWTPRSHR